MYRNEFHRAAWADNSSQHFPAEQKWAGQMIHIKWLFGWLSYCAKHKFVVL